MKKNGFSLIELIAVTSIIFILFGLVFTIGHAVRDRAERTEAAAMISSLEAAISMYFADLGIYPANGIASPTSNDLRWALVTNWTAGWHGPYMEFDADMLDGNGNIIDPWGNAYNYDASNPPNNAASYDLWSFGPDGAAAGEDDITNW